MAALQDLDDVDLARRRASGRDLGDIHRRSTSSLRGGFRQATPYLSQIVSPVAAPIHSILIAVKVLMVDASYNLNGGFKPTLKRFADLDGPDFYPTPDWATYALLDNEPFAGEIWEPACGNGAMARVLALRGNPVIATDLYDRGFGEAGVDFLKSNRTVNNIVTNPPYNAAEGFFRVGIKNARHKFALLLRLAFLEGANRANTIFTKCPPSRVWVFSERITFYPAGAVQKGTGTTAYAWFIWDKASSGATVLKWFKPGYKNKCL